MNNIDSLFKKNLLENFLKIEIFSSIIFTIFLLILNINKLTQYKVSGDDYSLIEASKYLRLKDWLFSGFSDYFMNFRDFSNTNFIRPIFNISFFINHKLFGQEVSLYLISSVLFVGLLFYVTTLLVKPTIFNLAFLAIFLIGNGSIGYYALKSPPYSFDVLAATFVIFSIYLVKKNNYFLSFFTLTLAVFTKEISYPACVAFFLWSIIFPIKNFSFKNFKFNQYFISMGFLSPLFIMFLVRIFGIGSGGNYAINNLSFYKLAQRVFYFPFNFPVGIGNPYSIKNVILGIINFDIKSIFNFSLSPLLNICFFALTCFLIFIYSKNINFNNKLFNIRQKNESLVSIEENKNYCLIFLVLIFSIIFLIFVGGGLRFYPLSQICIFILFINLISKYANKISILKILVFIIFSFYSTLSFIQITNYITYKNNEFIGPSYVFPKIISDAKSKDYKNILILNLPTPSSLKYISSYYDFPGNIDALYSDGSPNCQASIDSFNLKEIKNSNLYNYSIRIKDPYAVDQNNNRCSNKMQFHGYQWMDKFKIVNNKNSLKVKENLFIFNNKKIESIPFNIYEIEEMLVKKKYDELYIADYLKGEFKILLHHENLN